HTQTVDDAVDPLERDDAPGCDAFLHAGCARRLDADDPDVWVDRLERHRYARDQPAAADWHDDDVGLRKVFVDFEAERPLPGYQLGIVERMDVREAALDDELLRPLVRLIPDRPVQHHFGAVATRRGHFGQRRVLGHHDDGVHAVQLRGQRDALRVVAGRRADDAAALLLVGQVRELVQRPADFVRPGPLEHFSLEANIEYRA